MILSLFRPIVFILKNFENFEANLVMSTLSPEDEEFECQSESQAQSDSQNVSIRDRTKESQHETNNENSSDTSNSMRKRVHSNQNNSEASELGSSRINALEVVRKKRRTTNEHQDKALPMVYLESSNHTENPPPKPIHLESDDIEVEFQDESNDINSVPAVVESENLFSASEHRERRDHRPLMRQVFRRCFIGNSQTSQNYGEVLAECSDEE